MCEHCGRGENDDRLKELVREFFDSYLDYSETHGLDNHVVRPIGINCGRAMMIEPLGKLLTEMKVLSHK